MRRRWSRAARCTADAGTSAVELSVAALVGSLLLAGVATVWVGALHTVHTVDVSTSAVADGRLGLEAISRTLRVAYRPGGAPAAFIAADPQGVTFWALLNRTGGPSLTEPQPTLVSYAYDGTCVTETQTAAGVTRRKCLVRTAVAPTFSYYAADDLATGGSGGTAVAASPSVSATDLPTIRGVEVSLGVRAAGDPTQAVVRLVNRVTLTNLVQAEE